MSIGVAADALALALPLAEALPAPLESPHPPTIITQAAKTARSAKAGTLVLLFVIPPSFPAPRDQ
jgi:ribonuclease BN (tRNA processing enzyme)